MDKRHAEERILKNLYAVYNDDIICTRFFEQIKWSNNIYCPHCGCSDIYTTKTRSKTDLANGYRCKKCDKKFTVKHGSIFRASKIPMRHWLAAIALATNSKDGISSTNLAELLGITQKSAWHMINKIRLHFEKNAPDLLKRGKTS